MSTRETAAGAIYDIGYRKYEGVRLGRGYAFRTLFAHSFRTAWGLGRGPRAKVVPFLLLALVSVPALVQVAVSAISGGQVTLVSYENYFEFTQLLVTIFCAAQAAELVSTDQQHRVLPLYFSRALRRDDYAAAKLLAMLATLLCLVLVPQLLLFAGHLSLKDDLGEALAAEGPSILPILGSALTVAAVMGTVSLALASLNARRAIASATILGLFLLTLPVAAILEEAGFGERAELINPVLTIDAVSEWLFEGSRPPAPPPAPEKAAAEKAASEKAAASEEAAESKEAAESREAAESEKDAGSEKAAVSEKAASEKAKPAGPPPPEPDPLPKSVFLAVAALMALLSTAILFTRYRKVST